MEEVYPNSAGASGSGEKFMTWLETWDEGGNMAQSSGGVSAMKMPNSMGGSTSIPIEKMLSTSSTSSNPSEEASGDFTRMLLGSLNISGDDFTLPARPSNNNPFAAQLLQEGPPPIPLPSFGETQSQMGQREQLPSFAMLPRQNQPTSYQQLPPQPQFLVSAPPQHTTDPRLQQQLEQLRLAQQHLDMEQKMRLQKNQFAQLMSINSQQMQQDNFYPPQQLPQQQSLNNNNVKMSYMTPLNPLPLPPLYGNFVSHMAPFPQGQGQYLQPQPQHLQRPPPQQVYPIHPQLPQYNYDECTLARFAPEPGDQPEITPSTNLGTSAKTGKVEQLIIIQQPFYQPEIIEGDEPLSPSSYFIGELVKKKETRPRAGSGRRKSDDAGDGRRGSKGGDEPADEGDDGSEVGDVEEEEERPRFPFILKLATKRKEEEHMRFGFSLDPAIKGKPLILTIKEEILQRPPRKEKTSKKDGEGGSGVGGGGGEGGGGSGVGNGGGGATKGRARGRGSKKTKVKENDKEDPNILFRARLEPSTTGTADMRASSVHGQMTPLHWVLDTQELTLTFKAAEGSGMNIIRYQFHVQLPEGVRSNTQDSSPYIAQPGTEVSRWVGMSVPAIICSHSTSQFQRALLALIHYHFMQQDLVAPQDVLACFELLAGGSFKYFREAFASFPLPAGSSVVRGTDIPAVLEWFLSSWKIFSVDNYMALYKMGYVHGFLSREQAQEAIENQDEGTFLIRLGSNGLSMSLKYGGQIMPVEIDPNTLKQISITVAADPAVQLLCRDGHLIAKERLIQAITAIPRFGYASVAKLASLVKERQEGGGSGISSGQTSPRNNGDEGDLKRKRNI